MKTKNFPAKRAKRQKGALMRAEARAIDTNLTEEQRQAAAIEVNNLSLKDFAVSAARGRRSKKRRGDKSKGR